MFPRHLTAHLCRPSRIIALASLLAGVALLPGPLSAAEREDTAATAQAAAAGLSGASLLAVQADDDTQGIMAQDDDDEGATETGGTNGRERNDQDRADGNRWSHNRDQAQQDDRFPGQHGPRDGWNQARGGQGGWDHRDMDHRGWTDRDEREGGPGAGWSPERRRMMAMHGRMMQMMRGRQQGAAFRIEMGGTRMAVRCNPQETMRECVDATLSLVNRLRDAAGGAKPTTGPDAGSGPSGGSPSAPSSPGGAGSTPQ